jgi:hypothetical protein
VDFYTGRYSFRAAVLQLPFNPEKLFPQEFFPGTSEGAAQAEERRQGHVDCTGFELLHGSQFEVHSLRQP